MTVDWLGSLQILAWGIEITPTKNLQFDSNEFAWFFPMISITANLLGEVMGTLRGYVAMGMKNQGHSPDEGNAKTMCPPNPHNF